MTHKMTKFFSVASIFWGICSTFVEQILIASNQNISVYQRVTPYIHYFYFSYGEKRRRQIKNIK